MKMSDFLDDIKCLGRVMDDLKKSDSESFKGKSWYSIAQSKEIDEIVQKDFWIKQILNKFEPSPEEKLAVVLIFAWKGAVEKLLDRSKSDKGMYLALLVNSYYFLPIHQRFFMEMSEGMWDHPTLSKANKQLKTNEYLDTVIEIFSIEGDAKNRFSEALDVNRGNSKSTLSKKN